MVPIEARRELWAWYYGMWAFEHCRPSCQHILKERLDENHPLYYPMNVAATINYARPFRRSNGLPARPEDIVPSKYRAVHERVMLLRDKLHAHTDTDKSAHPGLMTVDVLFEVTARHKGFKTLEAPRSAES